MNKILLLYLITIAPFDLNGSSNVTVILSEPVTIKRTFVGSSGIPEIKGFDEILFLIWITYVFDENPQNFFFQILLKIEVHF